jgi:hypothetical protein
LNLGFLFASHSRSALEVAREFVSLLFYQTICEHYREQTHAVEAAMSKLDNIDDQIELAVSNSDLPADSIVSVGIDAMAMNSGKSTFPGSHSEYLLVLDVQSLDRRCNC